MDKNKCIFQLVWSYIAFQTQVNILEFYRKKAMCYMAAQASRFCTNIIIVSQINDARCSSLQMDRGRDDAT